MNDASRPLLSLFALAALSGCLDDTTAATRRASAHRDAQTKYAAAALASAALSMATGQAAPNVTQQGRSASSMLCPLFNGTTRGYFITWPNSTEGTEPGALRGATAARVGSKLVTAANAGGGVIVDGVDLGALKDCRLPVFEPGTPIVAVPVTIPGGTFAALSKEETRAEDCPAGHVGALISRRKVTFDETGKETAGPWELDDMAGCAPTGSTAVTITRPALAPWSNGGDGTLDKLLVALSPTDCTTVEAARTVEAEQERTAYSFSTCAAVALPQRPKIVCPPGPIVLPSYSTREDYAAAVAPYEEILPALPPSCRITIKADAFWPYWQSFNVEAAGVAFTRLYHVRLPMTWTGEGGDAALTFAAWHYRSLWSIPVFYNSDNEHWFKVVWSNGDHGHVYSMRGRAYFDFVGPNTAPAVGALRGWGAPLPYPNPGPNPWGNNAEQAQHYTGISYNAFKSRNYIYEASF